MAKVQTLTEMRAMLEAAGIRPQRRFGQNFFIDGNLLRRLVDAAEIQPHDTVVEIGGGTGVLTDLLAERCGRLLVVEIDHTLARMLTERFEDCPHVTIHQGDALCGKHRLCEFLTRELMQTCAGCRMLVANLPYNIATPLLIDLLIAVPEMTRFCFTVQKEVADRFTAQPRSKAYGPVSIMVQALCEVRVVAQVPPQSFWPRPKVDSQMLKFERTNAARIPNDRIGAFAELVRQGFVHRRKLVNHNLALKGIRLDEPWASGKMRPEELTVEDWVSVFSAQG